MEPRKVDLAALALDRESEKWRSLVERIAREGIAVRRERLSLVDALYGWLRTAAPAAALAAAVVVVVVLASGTDDEAPTGAVTDPTAAVLAWGNSDQLPDSATVLRVLGGGHER